MNALMCGAALALAWMPVVGPMEQPAGPKELASAAGGVVVPGGAATTDIWDERCALFGGDEWVTRASRDSAMGFTLSIEIAELAVRPGDRVTKGQMMIRGRDSEILASLAVQKSAAGNDTEVKTAETNLELAKSRFAAVEKVMERDAGTSAEYDERRVQRDGAVIAVEAAKKRLELEVLRFEQLRRQAERYRVEAPFDGVVDTLAAEVGQTVTEQSPVIRVVNIDALWIDVPVRTDATILKRLTPGHSAWALLDLPGEPIVLKGAVLYVSSVADAASGTRRVRVEVANPSLWPAGTRARVRFDDPGANWNLPATKPVASAEGAGGAKR